MQNGTLPPRSLTVWDLVVFGILCVTPIAPLPLFGIAQQLSHGHAVITILFGMVAMMLTALSYGRMAALYPVAGSAFTYVGRELNAHLGFLVGWAMILDYLLIPIINVVYCSVTLRRMLPEVPQPVFAAGMVVLSSWINLRGIKTGAHMQGMILWSICCVLLWFVVVAIFRIVSIAPAAAAFVHPFAGPEPFEWTAVLTATSFAALTYIGFDSVTTLAENVENPRRTVPFATVLVCLLTGLGGGFLVYLAQLVWPEVGGFKNIETAFLDVTNRVGGESLLSAFTAVLLVAQFASGLTGHAGAARLMFGMSRDGALPKRLARLNAKSGQPVVAIIAVAVLTFMASLTLSFEQGAELLNFGAFLGFVGVNIAAGKAALRDEGTPIRRTAAVCGCALGLLFCVTIWVGLPWHAKIIGGIWLALGVAYQVFQTRGYRLPPRLTQLEG